MDEYLRNRYKKVDSGGSAEPPPPPNGRYRPSQPERSYRQQVRPMFPINARPSHSKPKIEPGPAPTQQHQPTTGHHAAAARQQTAIKHHSRPKRRFPFVKILVTLLILGLGGGGGYYYLVYTKAPTPLPQYLVESADFPIYYPTELPGGYKYQPGTANNQKGLFIYKIADGSNGVVISEQIRPSTNFNPSGLPNFKSISVSDGSAVIGTSGGVTTVVYVTPTTLINMTAINVISRGDMTSIAQNLNPVKKQAKLL